MARRAFPPSTPERHIDALGFNVWRAKVAPMRMAHTHPDIEVNFLFTGGFSYLHGGKVAAVEPLRFTVLWGGVPHCTLESVGRSEGIWLTLPLVWFLRWQLPGRLSARLLGGEVVAARTTPPDQPMLERWLDDFKSGRPGRRHALLLELEARFHRLAWDTARTKKATRLTPPGAGALGQVERICDYIARHYRDPLQVGTIAAALHLHAKYLMRLFKSHTRMNVWEYVTRIRVAQAQRLLLTTDMKVVDIALASGFGSLGPFYRAFAAHASGSKRPLEYRRQGR